MPPRPRVAVLLRLIDQAYDKKSWHGTNLRGSLRGLGAEEASWRPTADRHNIWELAVHAAYWKYSIVRRLRGGERGSFPVKGSNWFRRPEGGPDEKAWKEDLALLGRMHRELREAVEKHPRAHLRYLNDGGGLGIDAGRDRDPGRRRVGAPPGAERDQLVLTLNRVDRVVDRALHHREVRSGHRG